MFEDISAKMVGTARPGLYICAIFHLCAYIYIYTKRNGRCNNVFAFDEITRAAAVFNLFSRSYVRRKKIAIAVIADVRRISSRRKILPVFITPPMAFVGYTYDTELEDEDRREHSSQKKASRPISTTGSANRACLKTLRDRTNSNHCRKKNNMRPPLR